MSRRFYVRCIVAPVCVAAAVVLWLADAAGSQVDRRLG